MGLINIMVHPTSCCVLLIVVSVLAGPGTRSETIYEVLEYYGFPRGLIPKDVVSKYELSLSTGQFEVYLNTTCEFTAYHYEVAFKTKVTGVVSKEEIKNIHGVEVRIMNFMTDLRSVEMIEDSEEIEFSAGYKMAVDFPVYNFYSIPECGCGFDCGHSP